MQLKLRIWTALLGIGILAATGVQPASSLPPDEITRDYFSGPDFNKMVGTQTLRCFGRRDHSGTMTKWYLEATYSCHTGGFAKRACYSCRTVPTPGEATPCDLVDCPPGVEDYAAPD